MFRGVNTGTALTDIIENARAGTFVNGSGATAAVADTGVTTLGADRLALQFVAVDDDNPVGAFAGATGGIWAEAIAEFASATGTDGCIQLQIGQPAIVATLPAGATPRALWGYSGGTTEKIATSFLSGAGGAVANVLFQASLGNAPTDDLVVEIQTDSAGAPSGTVLGSASIAAGALSLTAQLVTLPLSASLAASTTYWLVWRRTGAGDNINVFNVFLTATAYADGVGKTLTGGAWGSATTDLAFALSLSAAGTINGGSYTMAAADNWGVIGLALIPPPSGTAHTVPLADTLSLTDSLTSAKGKAVAVPDTLALADLLARATTTARTVADAVALTDQLARAHTALRTVADTVALADTATPVKSGGVDHTQPLADTVTLADTFGRAMAYQRTQAEGGAVSAFPVDAGRVATSITTAADPWTINLPASIVAGDLLILAVRGQNTAGETPPAGWTTLAWYDIPGGDADASGDTAAVFYRWADGTEGTTLNWDQLTTAKGIALCWRVTGAANPATRAPELARANYTTAANSADPPTLTPTGGSKDYLILTVGHQQGEVGAFTAAPSGYTNLLTANSGTGGLPSTNTIGAGASKQVTGSSEDPGVWTHGAADTGGMAITIAIHPAAVAAPGLALTDSVTRGYGRTQTDTLTLADQLARVMSYGRTQADGLVLVDATIDAQGIRLGDVLALADQLTRIAATVRTFADALALADATTRTAGKARALADAVALADELGRAHTALRTLADTIALTDARAIAQGQALTDAVALIDQLTRIAPRIRTFADTVLLSDATLTSKTGTGLLNPADLILVADSFARLATYGRQLADQVFLADLLARAMGRARTLADAVVLTDSAATHKVTAGNVLNYADAIYLGSTPVDRVYVGAEQVWPP